jgi:dihydrodipicolinate synthase/N-acetylneuraminate lyase
MVSESEGGADGTSLRGAFPVLPTPLTARGELDLASLKSLVQLLRGHELAGLTVLGSGGELPYLTLSEREDVVRAVRAAAPDSFRVIVGMACFGVVQAVDEARRVAAAGADALLVALPQYYPTPDRRDHRSLRRDCRRRRDPDSVLPQPERHSPAHLAG